MSTPTGTGLAVLARRAFAAVLFDLDGTLIDSTPAVTRSWDRWAAGRGVPRPVVPHGVPGRQVIAGLVPPGDVEAAFAVLEAIEVEEIGGIAALPGAVDALAAVPADRQAIVTSGTPPLVASRLRATGLTAPAVVVTADDVPRGKPHPDPFLLAAERLGVPAALCLVVEDAPAGLAAARAAGCASLAVLTSHAAADLPADAVVADLSAVAFTVAPDGAGGVAIRLAPRG